MTAKFAGGPASLTDFIADLKRKDFAVALTLERRTLRRADAVDRVAAAWRPATPLVRFLCAALDVPF